MNNGVPELAVLISGGLDSAILLGDALGRGTTVHPIYVRTGLFWESVELEHLLRFLAALDGPRLKPLTILEEPVGDVYGTHWSFTGKNVPDASTPDEAVYLPGRNVLLLGKALIWCHLRGITALALGTLGSNPFPDATAAFFDGFASLVSQAINGRVTVQRPFAELHKTDVMRLGGALPLQWTFSCMRPISGKHCGRCNKCAERRKAFRDASMPDPTHYAGEQPCSA